MIATQKVVLIRHAETDLAGTFCGHLDPPLNKRGDQQISHLLRSLTDVPIDAIYSSDLQRAAQTADAIAHHRNLFYTSTASLREIAFGAWEGLTWSQIESCDALYAQRWLDRFPDLPAPHGEAFSAFEERILRAWDSIASQEAGRARTIAVVTHAGVLRVLLTKHCGFSQEQAFEQTSPYCALFTQELPLPANQAVTT